MKHGKNKNKKPVQVAENESSSEDDEDAELLTEDLEKGFFKVLSGLKKKDAKLYDEGVKYYPTESFEKDKKVNSAQKNNKIKKVNRSYKEWLKGQQLKVDDEEIKNDLAALHDFWANPNLSKQDKFLRDYVLNKKYLEHDANFDMKKALEKLNEEEKELEAQVIYEHSYNYRFENADNGKEEDNTPLNTQKNSRKKKRNCEVKVEAEEKQKKSRLEVKLERSDESSEGNEKQLKAEYVNKKVENNAKSIGHNLLKEERTIKTREHLKKQNPLKRESIANINKRTQKIENSHMSISKLKTNQNCKRLRRFQTSFDDSLTSKEGSKHIKHKLKDLKNINQEDKLVNKNMYQPTAIWGKEKSTKATKRRKNKINLFQNKIEGKQIDELKLRPQNQVNGGTCVLEGSKRQLVKNKKDEFSKRKSRHRALLRKKYHKGQKEKM